MPQRNKRNIIKQRYDKLPQAKCSFLSLLTISLSYKHHTVFFPLLSWSVYENTKNTIDNNIIKTFLKIISRICFDDLFGQTIYYLAKRSVKINIWFLFFFTLFGIFSNVITWVMSSSFYTLGILSAIQSFCHKVNRFPFTQSQ